MIEKKIINGKVFIAQTTYYVYRDEDELRATISHPTITSSSELFKKWQEAEQSTIMCDNSPTSKDKNIQ